MKKGEKPIVIKGTRFQQCKFKILSKKKNPEMGTQVAESRSFRL